MATWVPVVVALITIVPATLAAWFTYDSRKTTKAISTAVNHVPEGSPTLIARVCNIEDVQARRHAWHVSAMSLLFRQIGIEMPPPPDEHVGGAS